MGGAACSHMAQQLPLVPVDLVEKGQTALHFGARAGHADVVHMLLEGKANPNALTTEAQATPLMYASAGGHTHVVRALLRAGARNDIVSYKGNTALSSAMRSPPLHSEPRQQP